MTDHLTPAQLSALADGELAGDKLIAAREHLDNCLPCAKSAVDEWLLKSAVAKAGQRYEMPEEFRERMTALLTQKSSRTAREQGAAKISSRATRSRSTFAAWATAAALLLVLGIWSAVQYRAHTSFAGERAALVTEACDLHIAMLAANQPPQIVSSDRHTVKPWFQGKLPFTFNLPETLPADTTLDGANLAYLHNHPAAQLLFSIGRHRVSVLIEEKSGGNSPGALQTAHDGFNVAGFETDDLEVIAVSDVDPARLASLVTSVRAVQSQH
jgi:anti-sigma factor RsiW